MNETFRRWAVVPAAGTGSRMGAEIPKQYLPLCGRPVIEHTLRRLASVEGIGGIVVAVGENDSWWPRLQMGLVKPLISVTGGAERCHSVLNALDELKRRGEEGWVLVHDAARPCVRVADIERLISAVEGRTTGGLLGTPVSDTVKRTDGRGEVLSTVDREGLWRAFTPQMFPLGPLYRALGDAVARGERVTDEASAMELAGHAPLMVEGHADNIKITRPADLAMAEFFLRQQERESCG